MRVLLDTNAYSGLMRGHARVAALVRGSQEVLLSAVVAGELMFGFRNGRRLQQNLDELETFLANPFVTFLPVTMVTADRFGRIAASLRRKGRPIPTNDIWLAAHAMESGADLVSFDAHFREIDGIVHVDPDHR